MGSIDCGQIGPFDDDYGDDCFVILTVGLEARDISSSRTDFLRLLSSPRCLKVSHSANELGFGGREFDVPPADAPDLSLLIILQMDGFF